MPEADPKRVVQRMIEQSMIDGDIDGALAAYAPDVVYHNPMLRQMPPVPDMREVLRELLSASRAAFPGMTYTVDALVAEDDLVGFLYTWRATHTGALAAIPPTGQPVTATGAIFCRVADGKIVEQWDIDDRLDVMQQLGLIPAMNAAPAAR
jgi:steroid delta-isomerase-like uncharacterized protein